MDIIYNKFSTLTHRLLKRRKVVLDDRKKRILQAIIDEYISTAEPVSSGSIVKKYGFDFSSATIRNEMAELEKIGYLDKMHTSSGRIPSSLGYRFYVDELIKEDNISYEEIRYIQSKLQTKVNQIEDLTKIATHTLSEITHYTTVAIGPANTEQTIEEIKFVLLGTRMLMAVILTDTGLIKETMIKFEEDITEEQVQTLNSIFNNKLKGRQLSQIDVPLEQYIFSEMKDSLTVIKPVMEQISSMLKQETPIYLEGANKAFELPEFRSLEVAKKFIQILDTKELVLDILNTGFAQDINIYIGNETEHEELRDFSIVTFKHKIRDKELGTIGIIGPTRMDYSKVISVMKYINKMIGENFEEKQ